MAERYLLKADRTTYAIRHRLSEFASSAGGGYVKEFAAWDFNGDQEAYQKACELKQSHSKTLPGIALSPNGGTTSSALPRKASTYLYEQSEEPMWILENDPIVEKFMADALTNDDLCEIARNGSLGRWDNGSYVFLTKKDLDIALRIYDTTSRKHALEEAIAQAGGYNITDPATYPLQDEFRGLGGQWIRVAGTGFWHFTDQDNAANALALLAEFHEQPISITDPNAIYCRKDLARLGWDEGGGKWRFPTQNNLERANALIAEVRVMNPRMHQNLLLAVTLGADKNVLGFDPHAEPERLNYLDRFAANQALQKAKHFLAERKTPEFPDGIDLEMEIRRNSEPKLLRQPSEIITGAAARYALPDDKARGSVGDYAPEHDEQQVARDAAHTTAGHADEAATLREVQALIASTKEQLRLTMDEKSLVFELAKAPASNAMIKGHFVAVTEHYIAQRTERIENDIPQIRYAIFERARFVNELFHNETTIPTLINRKIDVVTLMRDGLLVAGRTEHEANYRIHKLEQNGHTPASIAAHLDIKSYPKERTAINNTVQTILQPEVDLLRRDLERSHLQRAQEAEKAGKSFLETLRVPNAPKEISLQFTPPLQHGKIIGDYGQDAKDGKTWKPPVSKNFIALQDIDRNTKITLFDTRACDTKFGTEIAIRRKFADTGIVVTVGWAGSSLAVWPGTMNQHQLESRQAYSLSHPEDQRRATPKSQQIELEIGSYDNIIREDLEFAQRHGRQILATKLGKDLNEIRIHLITRGSEPTTEQVLQFAGIGSHIIDPRANEKLRGAEVIDRTKYHTTLAFKRNNHHTVASLSRADIYLTELNREPHIGEKVTVAFESGILKTCERYTGQSLAREIATQTLASTKTLPSFETSRQAEIDRVTKLGRDKIKAARDLFINPLDRNNADKLEYLEPSREGFYEGQIIAYEDENGHPYYAQNTGEGRFTIHDATSITTPIQNGSWARIVYRDGNPCRTEAISLSELQRGTRPGESHGEPIQKPIGRETHQPGPGLEMGR